MLVAVLLATLLVVATFSLHYKVLRTISTIVPQINLALEARVLCVILIAFLAHIVEAIMYAIAFWISVEYFELGAFGGLKVTNFLDYLYFSLVSYTTLGLGDVFPGGHIRFLTGVEALNGLLLIAWSGSYTYLAMGRLWPWRPCEVPR